MPKESQAPKPKIYTAGQSVKTKLLKPAQTSLYQVYINVDTNQAKKFFSERNIPFSPQLQELITLSCSDASLPGSSVATSENTDKFHGVNHKYGYRRLYDDRADFTFYVDAPIDNNAGYNIIYFFEQWISYVVGENDLKRQFDKNYSYRVNYPEDYQSRIAITKFEKDHNLKSIRYESKQKSKHLTYYYINAFPISISSMPVAYEQSQLLKCTVSFSYLRYVIQRESGLGEIEISNFTPQESADLNGRGFNLDGQVGDFYSPQTVPSVQSPAFATPTTAGLA